MSGETENNISGWTVDTLHSHLDQRLDEQSSHFDRQIESLKSLLQERYDTQTKALDAAFKAQQLAMQTAMEAAERAVAKAETAAEKRFDSVNEFRAQLADQATTFLPRAEGEAALARNTERIQELADRFNKSEGRGLGLNAGWIYILGAIAAIGTIVSIFLMFRI